MDKRYFGTDGIRGRVGEAPITPDFILKLGWAAGRVFAAGGGKKVLIGKDTRISGYMFESALEAGLSAAGVDSRMLGPMPTPAIAYLTRTLRASAGIVISASHNPHEDNGIKFFSPQGTKLDDATELAIEAELDKPLQTVASARLGKASRLPDGPGRYIEFCKRAIAPNVEFNGMKMVLDCANGATYHVAPALFHELGAEVVKIGAEPDGLNINVDCGSIYPGRLAARVQAEMADVGIAFDGDGDRVIMVDEQGEVLDGDELIYIIACARKRQALLNGPVVGTLMTNLGLELALEQLGVAFHRAKVGDRYVMELLQAKGGMLGGESSGHIICLDRTTTGDGMVSALQVLEVMQDTGKPLSELKRGMHKFPQHMINVPVQRKSDIHSSPAVEQAVREVEGELGKRGRVLLRPSGTEPVVRVMVECEDGDDAVRLCEQLAAALSDALAAAAAPAAAAN